MMTYRWSRVAACALATAVIGCESTVAPPTPLAVEFTYALVGAPGAPAGTTWPPTVTVDGDQLVLLGRRGAGTPCHTLQASAVALDTVVRVRVVASRGSSLCFDEIAEFAYRLTSPRPVSARRLVLEYAERDNRTTGPYSTVHETALVP